MNKHVKVIPVIAYSLVPGVVAGFLHTLNFSLITFNTDASGFEKEEIPLLMASNSP